MKRDLDCIFKDIAKKYYSRQYNIVALLDLSESKAYLINENGLDSSQADFSYNKVLDSINEFKERRSDDKSKILDSADSLREYLEKNDSYFHTTLKWVKEECSVYSIEVKWYDKERNLALGMIQDVSKIGWVDMLTGNTSQFGFLHECSKIFVEEPNEKYTVLYFNIKRLRTINELAGLPAGNQLIRQTYQAIRKAFFNPIAVGKSANDRFICLVKGQGIDYGRLKDFCRFRFNYEEFSALVYMEVGVYEVEDNAMPVGRMLDFAQLALNYVHDIYTEPYAVYNESLLGRYLSKTSRFGSFEDAFDNREFKIYVQPIVDAVTGKIVSGEALSRWEIEGQGLIFPGEFMGELEETGYITKLDRFVADEILAFQQNRISAGGYTVPISINLSRMDFYDKRMISYLMEVAKKLDHNSELMRFEITETAYIELTDEFGEVINYFRGLGSKIMLDDFGSGYSSFSTLQNYDFDIIKLDMGFVRKIEDSEKARKIIVAIIDMAHRLGSKVVAEGVENKNQYRFLLEHNCDYVQGFYFYKPIPLDKFDELINDDMKVYVLKDRIKDYREIGIAETEFEIRALMACANITTFWYYPLEGVAVCNEGNTALFGCQPVVNCPEEFGSKYIHEDFRQIYYKAFEDIDRGCDNVSYEVYTTTGRYIRETLVVSKRTAEGKAALVLGMTEDITC